MSVGCASAVRDPNYNNKVSVIVGIMRVFKVRSCIKGQNSSDFVNGKQRGINPTHNRKGQIIGRKIRVDCVNILHHSQVFIQIKLPCGTRAIIQYLWGIVYRCNIDDNRTDLSAGVSIVRSVVDCDWCSTVQKWRKQQCRYLYCCNCVINIDYRSIGMGQRSAIKVQCLDCDRLSKIPVLIRVNQLIANV